MEESDDTFRAIQLDTEGKKPNDLGAYVHLYVEGDMVTGIVANNKSYGGWADPSIDELVKFPCGVDTGKTLDEIKAAR